MQVGTNSQSEAQNSSLQFVCDTRRCETVCSLSSVLLDVEGCLVLSARSDVASGVSLDFHGPPDG